MKPHALIYLAGSALLLASCSHKSETDESRQAMTVDVTLPIVKDVTLSSTYPGYLTADKAVNVVAQVSGKVMSMNYESGQMVKEGDVLFTIDSSKYRDAVQQAKASLDQAISQRDYAQSHYEAVKKALESEAVSKMEVQQAENALEQAEASISSARAALETANRNLGYCSVKAPISGQASSNAFSVGAYVNGEGSPATMATIYKNNPMTANISIEDERYLELLNSATVDAPRQNVTNTLASGRTQKRDTIDLGNVPLTFSESLPHTYTGFVKYLAPALNRSTGTMDLQVQVDNPYNELRAGMFVEVHLPYGSMENAVLVRDTSIGTNQLGKYLYVVNDSNKVVYTPVTVGDLIDDTLRIVTQGLRPTDRYVTSALLKVREGETVNPREIK